MRSPPSDTFDAFAQDAASYRPLVEHIAGRHHLGGPWERSASGSMIVCLSEELVIKVFPAFERRAFEIERAVLLRIEEQLGIPTPSLVHEGSLSDWSYLVMTRLAGRPIDSVWGALGRNERLRVVETLGGAVRRMHALSLEGLDVLERDFPAFRAGCRATCLEQERRAGLESPWTERHAAYLERHLEEPSAPSCLLHTELGPGHVLVEGGEVTGLFDFADAMLGDPEYDFAAVGLFVTTGDTEAFEAFLRACGVPEDGMNPTLQGRLFRHALLHRYGTLAWYLRKLSPKATTMEGLAAEWFGCSEGMAGGDP